MWLLILFAVILLYLSWSLWIYNKGNLFSKGKHVYVIVSQDNKKFIQGIETGRHKMGISAIVSDRFPNLDDDYTPDGIVWYAPDSTSLNDIQKSNQVSSIVLVNPDPSLTDLPDNVSVLTGADDGQLGFFALTGCVVRLTTDQKITI